MKIFAQLSKVVLSILGIKEIPKGEDGKFALSDEQKAQLTGVVGSVFVEKFEAAMNAENGEDHSTELVDALVASAAKPDPQVAVLQAALATEKKAKETLQSTILTLSATDEPEPPAVIPQNPAIAGKAGVPKMKGIQRNLGHYQAVEQFIISGRASDIRAAASTIDVANLVTEFGTFLSQNGNNLEEVMAIFSGFSSAKFFTSAMGTTEWRAIQPLITSVSQQWKGVWTPSGKSKFEPLTIRNRRHKINMPIVPSDVLESYMMYMYDERLSIDQMPITKYIWQKLVYPQLMQDIELRMIFKGKYVDAGVVTAGTPGTPPEDSMDGLETIIMEGKDGSKNINYFDLGTFNVLDPSNSDQLILEFFKEFTAWITPEFEDMGLNIGCSKEVWRRYKTAYKNVWGAGSGTTDPNFGGDQIDFSNSILTPMRGMYGSPILFATPKENLKKLRHLNDVPNVINDVQKQDYELRLFGEYWLAPGFAYGEGVFAAAPAGYNPKAKITEVYGASTTFQQNKGVIDNGPFQGGSGSAEGGV